MRHKPSNSKTRTFVGILSAVIAVAILFNFRYRILAPGVDEITLLAPYLDGNFPSDGDPADIPELLSETGAFSNLETLTPAEGILPYGLINKLWSDRADKLRWVSLPSGEEKVIFSEEDNWQYPSGTVFIKHFQLPINTGEEFIRLETRFLVIDEEGEAYGVTYQWNEEEADATLIADDLELTRDLDYLWEGETVLQTWEFPSREQCITCHNLNAGSVLGVRTNQLNSDHYYPSSATTAHQLETWNHLELFSTDISLFDFEQLPALSSLEDEAASNEDKFRSYISSNCSHCHQPGGVNVPFDARFQTPLIDQDIIYESLGGGQVVVTPSDLENSEIWQRDNSIGNNRMPPLGKTIIDTTYIKILEDWINELVPNTERSASICYGEDFELPDGELLTGLTKSYVDINRNPQENGIDQLEIFRVIVNQPDTTALNIELCPGDVYEYPDGTTSTDVVGLQVRELNLINEQGCDSTVYINVNLLSACEIPLAGELPQPTLSLYPNPGQHTFTLEGISERAVIEVVSLSGKKIRIQTQSIDAHTTQLTFIQSVTAGIYFVVISEEGEVDRMKLWVQK